MIRPRKRPKQERARATLDAILEATAQILERDESELKTSDVAKRAGVSIGSLYQYFPGKDALISALIGRFVGRKFDEIAEKLDRFAELPLEEAVTRFVDEALALEKRTLGLGQSLMHLMFRLGSFDIVGEVDDQFIEVLRGFLRRMRAQTRPLDEEKAAFVLVYAFRSTLASAAYKRQNWLEDPGFRDELVHLVLGYLRA